MDVWTIALIQLDVKLAQTAHNRSRILAQLERAATEHGAQLAIFPECAVTGYCFASLDEALAVAEPIPGPTTDALAEVCSRLSIYCIVGLLERDQLGRLFNACVLVGPGGLVSSYRKVHLPCLGVDRFATPGDRPFAVYDIGGLRVGMMICYDNSFPEAARILALEGADLIALPTNWPTDAACVAEYLVPARALENRVYFAACNRVGEERSTQFIGGSRFVDYRGEKISQSGTDEGIILGEVNPAKARQKRIVHIPGEYEVDRINDRRPEMYGRLVQ